MVYFDLALNRAVFRLIGLFLWHWGRDCPIDFRVTRKDSRFKQIGSMNSETITLPWQYKNRTKLKPYDFSKDPYVTSALSGVKKNLLWYPIHLIFSKCNGCSEYT